MLGLLQDGCHQAYYAKHTVLLSMAGQWSALCSQKSTELSNAAQQTPRLSVPVCLEINKIFSFTLESYLTGPA